MREKRRQKKGENESERVAGERRRERFAGYNRKAQHTHKYHLPGLAHLRVRERERERVRDKGGRERDRKCPSSHKWMLCPWCPKMHSFPVT